MNARQKNKKLKRLLDEQKKIHEDYISEHISDFMFVSCRNKRVVSYSEMENLNEIKEEMFNEIFKQVRGHVVLNKKDGEVPGTIILSAYVKFKTDYNALYKYF